MIQSSSIGIDNGFQYSFIFGIRNNILPQIISGVLGILYIILLINLKVIYSIKSNKNVEFAQEKEIYKLL